MALVAIGGRVCALCKPLHFRDGGGGCGKSNCWDGRGSCNGEGGMLLVGTCHHNMLTMNPLHAAAEVLFLIFLVHPFDTSQNMKLVPFLVHLFDTSQNMKLVLFLVHPFDTSQNMKLVLFLVHPFDISQNMSSFPLALTGCQVSSKSPCLSLSELQLWQLNNCVI